MATISPISTKIPSFSNNSKQKNSNAISTSNIRRSLISSQKSVIQIQKILKSRIKTKKEIYSKIGEARRSQIIQDQRREREERLEYKKSTNTGNIQNSLSTAVSSGGGFLSRLLKALGFILVGAMIKYLPPLIGYAKEFLARIIEFSKIVRGFIGNMKDIFVSVGNLLKGFAVNLSKFDFFDSENRVKNSFNDLKLSIDGIVDDYESMIDIFTTDITKEIDGVQVGSYSEEKIPPVGGTPPQKTGESGAGKRYSPGSSGSGGGVYNPILNLIAKYESGSGGYESMYPGTRLPGATKMTISEVSRKATGAVGMWQNLPEYLVGRAKAVGLDPDTALYNEENQRKIAVYLIEKGQAGVTPQMLKNNPDEAMIRLARVWAAIPVPKDMQGNVRFVKRGQSYYAGVGNNKAHITPEMMYDAMGASVKKQETLATTKTSPQNAPSSSATKLVPLTGTSGSAGAPGRRISTPLSPLSSGAKIISGFGYRTGTKTYHKGYDIAIPIGTPVRAYFPGKVTRVGYEGGYGHYIEWKDSVHNQTHLYAHLDSKSSLKVGQSFDQGTQLGISGASGRVYGPHLHWEIGPQGSEVDPGVWLRSVGAKPTDAQMSPPSQKQKVAKGITPERRGGDVIAMISQPQSQKPPSPSTGGQDKVMLPPSTGDVLNRFVNQRLLLNLTYT
jgi:murein DD-endopeptidase MepM/ murein hydrolase activator NlpD